MKMKPIIEEEAEGSDIFCQSIKSSTSSCGPEESPHSFTGAAVMFPESSESNPSVELEKEGRRLNHSVLRWLPVISVIVPTITFVATYLTTTLRGTYPSLLPYISHTGNEPPESCIFSFGLSLTVILLAPIMVINYYRLSSCINVVFDPEVESQYPLATAAPPGSTAQILEKRHLMSWCHLYNRFALGAGLLAALGMQFVASFQENKVLSVHMIGAGMAFICANIYMILVMRILYGIKFHYCRRRLFRSRAALTIISLICIFVFLITMKLNQSTWSEEDMKQWHRDGRVTSNFDSKHKGFPFMIASSFAEWTMAICVFSFIGSMYFDFKHVGLDLSIEVRKVPGIKTSSLTRHTLRRHSFAATAAIVTEESNSNPAIAATAESTSNLLLLPSASLSSASCSNGFSASVSYNPRRISSANGHIRNLSTASIVTLLTNAADEEAVAVSDPKISPRTRLMEADEVDKFKCKKCGLLCEECECLAKQQ